MSRRAESALDATRAPGPGRIGCRRADILNLSVADYEQFAPLAERGFELAAKFLHRQKIFKSRDVPYRSQLVPLAAILAELGVEAERISTKEKLQRWYWNGVLGEAYGGSTETIFARDLPEVTDWIRGRSGEPSTVQNANFQANRLRTLRTRNSAAYKGVHALLIRDGGFDFLNGEPVEAQTYFDENIDIHHIFPQAWCKKQGNITSKDYNSIINKTALSARTNRRLGGRPPSVYCKQILREAGSPERMAEIFASHRIDGGFLARDDFWGFYRDRAARLLEMIEAAMGKRAAMDDADFAPDASIEEYDEGPFDYATEAASQLLRNR